MKQEDELPTMLVISFGCTVTHDQLDQLLAHCEPGASWEHLAMPAEGRTRLLQAIQHTTAMLSDADGRIMRQTLAEDFINSMSI